MVRSIKIVVFIATTLAVSVLIDRAIGLIAHGHRHDGLLFPPDSKAEYKTTEFTYTASINSLGFRDREFTLPHGSNYRIVAIGDSFTYGWGVEVEQSWPKILERELNNSRLHVEVANLGHPGDGPIQYAETANKAIPLLHPDLVIVEALQGDDLSQSIPQTHTIGSLLASEHSLAALIGALYPNIARLAAAAISANESPAGAAFKRDHPRMARLLSAVVHEPSVSAEWKSEQERILGQFNPEEKKRYEDLDPAVKEAFVHGGLNPALIESAVKHRDAFFQTFDIDDPYVMSLIDAMAKQFERIKKVSDRSRAKMIVVSVPFGVYVNDHVFETWRSYGFHVVPEMLASDSPDRAVYLACEKAGVEFFTATDAFRSHRDAHFFYTLDGHFNPDGHRFYAEQLTPALATLIRTNSH
ncbi:MAG TPA: SGNH/GDSL hydrolase family protein [Chthoniobacterales bacterium]